MGHAELDASAAFDLLGGKTLNDLLTFIDRWLQGLPIPSTRFHNFPSKPKYRDCMVFKPRGKHKEDRFYGYVCHPKPKTNPRFEACVLCIRARKNERETDDAELERVIRWKASQTAKEAVGLVYPDQGRITQ